MLCEWLMLLVQGNAPDLIYLEESAVPRDVLMQERWIGRGGHMT